MRHRALLTSTLALAAWTLGVGLGGAAGSARAIHVSGFPSSWVTQEVVDRTHPDGGCNDVSSGQRFPRPPSGRQTSLGCIWVTTGYSSGLGFYKYFCVIRHGGVALGSSGFAMNGKGWGTAHPSEIFNGGDPSGRVTHIKWTHWGSRVATGWGLNSIFKPHGGYYPNPVRIELHASRIGRCSSGGPRAYGHLAVRVPSRPGGPLGRWFAWSGRRSICSDTGA